MNLAKGMKLAVTAFGLALFAGCGSSGGGSGTGGSTGSGGSASGAGGTTGTGGSATGGVAGSGGATGSGGTTGTGGATGTGGGPGTGGVAGATGLGGTGGAAGASGGGGAAGGAKGGQGGGAAGSSGGGSGAMSLTSPDQPDGAAFGTMFTCAANNGAFGSGINPELDWTNVPAGTMSFAITFIDTKLGANNAMGQHWAIWDIPASARELPKGTTMLTGDLAGAMQTNKYLAPCPSGNDTYEYTLYALSTATLNVSGASGSGTTNSPGVAKVVAALQAAASTTLATATLHGTSGPGGQ